MVSCSGKQVVGSLDGNHEKKTEKGKKESSGTKRKGKAKAAEGMLNLNRF